MRHWEMVLTKACPGDSDTRDCYRDSVCRIVGILQIMQGIQHFSPDRPDPEIQSWFFTQQT